MVVAVALFDNGRGAALLEVLIVLVGTLCIGIMIGWKLRETAKSGLYVRSGELRRVPKRNATRTKVDYRRRGFSAVPAASSSQKAAQDLTKIEGIGPKIQEVLYEAGIMTYRDLADASRDSIIAILVEANPKYKMHEPRSWMEQAELAHDGDWKALSELQDRLSGGS